MIRFIFLAFLLIATRVHAQPLPGGQSALCNGSTVPAWVTANRPSSPNDGYTGYNLTAGYCESYSVGAAAWAPVIANAIDNKTLIWDSTLAVTAQTVTFPIAWGKYTITGVQTAVNGGGTFAVAVKIGSTTVTSCGAITVSGASNTTTACTAANTGVKNDQITVVISSISGTVNQAYVAVIFSHTAS